MSIASMVEPAFKFLLFKIYFAFISEDLGERGVDNDNLNFNLVILKYFLFLLRSN